MPLDPTLERLISKAYLNGFGNIHHFTPEQMRRYLSHPKLAVPQASYKDYPFQGAITLRCYTPTNCLDQILPAVIYLSATAFIIDRLDASNDYCSLLANTLKMKIVQVAHRLAPEHKFPRFLNDCLDGIKWVNQHAKDLEIDKDRIAIWGESSGGSIAASCTHILRDEGLPLLKHQTLFYPMVDLVTPFPSKTLFGHGYMLDKAFIEWLDKRGFHPEQDRAHPLASPLFSTNFSNLPPATIITAEYDPLRDEGEAYAQKLMAANIPLKFQRFDGMIHGFMRFYHKVLAAKEALDLACGTLKNCFEISSDM